MLVAVRISTGCHTNCHRWSGLTTEICFLTVLETGKSKIRMPAMVWFLVRRAPSWLSDSRLLSMSSHGGFYRDTNPIDQGPILLTPVNLNYFLTPNTAHWGVNTSAYEFGGDAYLVHNKGAQKNSLIGNFFSWYAARIFTYRYDAFLLF